jgi:hypothetical protein
MYSLIQNNSLRALLVEQLPVFLVSLFIAEMFYKFHSFLLESIAFLVTWFVLDWGYQAVRRAFSSDKKMPVA